MKILALEFSSDERSAALAEQNESGVCTILGTASETGGRSTRAIGLIESVLRQANVEREEINGIAVGIGPGSYTGIRVAISVAQGWRLARNISAFGISSVAGMAAQVQATRIFGKIHFIIDAQRNEFYVATYNISENVLTEIEPLHLVSAAEIESHASRGELIMGPDAKTFGQLLLPKAEFIARLAFNAQPVPAQTLEAIYLRETNFIKAPPARIVS